jgi:hypothetical protein
VVQNHLRAGVLQGKLRPSTGAAEPNNRMQVREIAGATQDRTLFPAPDAQRSASNGRLSWGEPAYSILSQYPAILDITTYLSLNKLFGALSSS